MGSTTITGTVATSLGSATLATLRDRVEQVLQDTGNATWSTAELDEAIRHAIDEYAQVSPYKVIGTITLAADGREVSLSTLTNLIYVERVWWEYTSSDPEYPPYWREFEQWPGAILWINDGEEPATDDVVRVYYAARHTLNGLDSAAITTVPNEHISLIVTGAAANAARNYSLSLSGAVNVDGWTPRRYLEWATAKETEFQNALRRLARLDAVRHSGITPAVALDRWDT